MCQIGHKQSDGLLGDPSQAPAPIEFHTAAPSRREGITHAVPVAENTQTLKPALPRDNRRLAMRGCHGHPNACVGHDATRHRYAGADIVGNVEFGAPSILEQSIDPIQENEN